ncbi:MAG TPA: mechanosensitive ion channel family protein [Solirubrobacteraceae bacterium]|nr:mechanosensitive ion channel family protein [Solirubrobacteraceae bacterium]
MRPGSPGSSACAVKRARIQAIVTVPVLIGILVVYGYRYRLFGSAYETPVQIATTVVLIVLGWQIARDVGRALGPTLFRRLDPGTAGTVGFLIRLAFVGLAIIVALRVAGLDPRTLAVGGAFTAVIVGLAAQQTLGNLIAGTVLLSARPFRVGERVRLQGGGIAGQIEGIVSSLGLLYTTFAQGDDHVMVPNSVVLNVAIVPLREPDGVDLRARLPADVTPLEVQQLLDSAIETPVRSQPRITLEELDGDEVVVRISATPERPSDGPRLASEVLEAVATQTGRAA